MSDIQYYKRRMVNLKAGRTSFEPMWMDIDDYLLPGATEFNVGDTNRGDRKGQKVINDTATDASRTLQSGMMGGMSSPARPWFGIQTGDSNLNEIKEWKVWLDLASKRISDIMLRSNIYQVLPQAYEDLGGFATTAFAVMEDEETVIRAYHAPIGSYWLGTSHRGVVDTYAREFMMTARQMVQKFGKDACSDKVSTAADQTAEVWFNVTHLVEPNPDFDSEKPHSKYKPFRSVYYEPSAQAPLSEMGHDEFPVIAARWSVRGSGIYGNRCPGIQCLGDVKHLQLGEKRGWQALDKLVDPPMSAPTALKGRKKSLLPGDVTYVDVTQGQQGFKTVYEINPHLAELDARLARLEARIRRAFFADLFLMISNMDGVQPRNTAEINIRKEEKMLMLGPVLERLNDEMFDPLIKRVYGIARRRGIIPPPPMDPPGVQLTIVYVSILAQAQKLIGTAAMEKMVGFILNMAQAFPGALDKYDSDQAIDDYAEMVGAGPKTVRDAKEVAGIRQARQKQQQAQQLMAASQQAAQTAQTLGTTPTNPDTALGAMLGRMGMPS